MINYTYIYIQHIQIFRLELYNYTFSEAHLVYIVLFFSTNGQNFSWQLRFYSVTWLKETSLIASQFGSLRWFSFNGNLCAF